MLGRAFKSGNSIAVRIPQEIGLIDAPGEVEIDRVGDTVVIRLLQRKSLADVGNKFAAFPSGFMDEGREFNPEQEREGW